METNFLGPFKIIQAVLPGMRERKRGTIVNVSSIGGLRALPAVSMYSASKYALEALSESLAAEVADFGIRLFIVEPGGFKTNFMSAGAIEYVPMSEQYKGTAVETTFEKFRDMEGKQVGDPDKGCQNIFEVVMGEGMAREKKEYLRLPLEKDCVVQARAKFRLLEETFDAMEEIASSTDLE